MKRQTFRSALACLASLALGALFPRFAVSLALLGSALLAGWILGPRILEELEFQYETRVPK